MNKTYIEMYTGEIRAVQIVIRDQNNDDFDPTDAYASVVDADDTVIVASAAALITDNKVTTLITTTTTGTIGTYYIIWKIIQTVSETNYTHYHKTRIEVMSL